MFSSLTEGSLGGNPVNVKQLSNDPLVFLSSRRRGGQAQRHGPIRWSVILVLGRLKRLEQLGRRRIVQFYVAPHDLLEIQSQQFVRTKLRLRKRQ